MRVVLDTNILVRAAADEESLARRVLTLIKSGPHLLVTSEFILDELRRVFTYPHIQARWPLAARDIEEFIAEFRVRAEVVKPRLTVRPGGAVSRNPKDEPIIQTARKGKANILCTWDDHILESEKVQAYCAKYGVRIMKDAQLLPLLTSGE